MALTESEVVELGKLLSLSTPRRRHHYRRMAELTQKRVASDAGAQLTVDDSEWQALLTQYESLREESMNSTNNRVQVLILGAAAMAAVVGGALTIDKPAENGALIFGLFSVAIPLMWIFVLLVWVSEAVRAHRVGSFLAGDVEARINARLGKLVLTWEAALWTGAVPRDERKGPSMMSLMVLFLFAVASPVFGIWFSGVQWSPVWRLIAQLGVPWALLLAAIIYVRSLRPRLENTEVVCSVWPGEQ